MNLPTLATILSLALVGFIVFILVDGHRRVLRRRRELRAHLATRIMIVKARDVDPRQAGRELGKIVGRHRR